MLEGEKCYADAKMACKALLFLQRPPRRSAFAVAARIELHKEKYIEAERTWSLQTCCCRAIKSMVVEGQNLLTKILILK